jgi:hypothetical protein
MTIDQVVSVSDPWRVESSRRRLKYFIPEWDDLVDPGYDFLSDTHSGGTGDWSNEVYAHQLFRRPNYDGVLMSREVYEKTRKKKERIDRLGIHRFLRLPEDFPVMGDCGAFGYLNLEEPPYTTSEVIDYYTRLGFNYGVSIDHLITTASYAHRKMRYDLTLDNAAEMMRLHGGNYPWTPIGAIQGWDAESYAAAAKAVSEMGYSYIGIGGLVRTRSQEVLRVLEAARAAVPPSARFHVFGLARLDIAPRMSELGVASVDSASPLRRAWFGSNKNYLGQDGDWYAAVRIPGVGSFRAKRIVSDGRADATKIARLERDCLDVMRQFDKGQASIDETIALVDQFDRLITPNRPVNTEALRRTLESSPWKDCPCEICKKAGIDVIIFRGNNRNRRRGFHNTYAFYRLLGRQLSNST